ncbi:MAG: DUF2807 domain-containing protein [Deltaproteobacteria bacterium]|nr:DUF2807 domain-containing protein [Deltaproteobacteria bacterium]
MMLAVVVVVACLQGLAAGPPVGHHNQRAGASQLEGNGGMMTEVRRPSGLRQPETTTSIVVKGDNIKGPVRVRVVTGETAVFSEVTSEPNLLPHLRVDVDGDTVFIRSELDLLTRMGITVVVHLFSLRRVHLEGAVDFEGRLTGDELSVQAKGAHKLTLAGAARSGRFDVDGAVQLDAVELQLDDVDVKATGAVDLQVHARRSLRMAGQGAGSLSYKGRPRITQDPRSAAVIRLVKLDPEWMTDDEPADPVGP